MQPASPEEMAFKELSPLLETEKEVGGGWVTTVLGFLCESVIRCTVKEGTDFLLFPF